MDGQQRASPIDRFLRLFTDVRTGESGTALLLMLNIFLILTAYSVMKVLREPLILAGGGAEVKSYSAAGQAIVLLGAVPLYGLLAGRFPRRKLINAVTAFFIVCIGAFYVLARLDVPIAVVFYIWLGIFSVMVIAQFWSFANDVYTNEEGKRLFPIVVFGASSGAVFGAWLPGRLIVPLGVYQLFLVSGGLLVIAVVISNIVDARERRRTEAGLPDVNTTGTMPAATEQIRAETGEFRIPKEEYKRESGVFRAVKPGVEEEEMKETPESTGSAFQLVFRSRYLLLIALLMLLLNWVNTTGEYILGRTISEVAADAVAAGEAGGLSEEELIGTFYSNFQSVVNVVGLLAQLFIVSRIIKYLGVAIAILVLPLIALVGYAAVALYPALLAVRWAKTAENSTDYSLQNTARNVLFLPTTREEKYKAKQVTDSFAQRAGDVMQAVLVFVGLNIFAFQTRHFAMANLVLIAVWLSIAIFIGRRYNRLAAVTAD